MPTNFTSVERIALLNILQSGRQNAIRAEDLARILRYPTTGNQVKLRKLIAECIEVDNDLIGAATGRPAGFFLIANISELEVYLDSLENRIRNDNHRRSSLLTNWNSRPISPNTNKHILTIS